MKRNSLLICLFAVLFLSSCGGRSKTASALANGDTIPLRYAENLTLMSYPGYTLATLRNPWDTLHTLHTYILVPKDRELPAHLPAGTVVRTPLSKSVIYSSVHCGLMDNLGVFGSIGGVCDLKYIKLPAVHEACRRGAIADCGDGMNPDMERIIDLHPDAILLSPFENSAHSVMAVSRNWIFPSSNVPTTWKPPLWDVPSGCVSTDCSSGLRHKPTTFLLKWTVVTNASRCVRNFHPPRSPLSVS